MSLRTSFSRIVLGAALALGVSAQSPAQESYILSTATTGGTYYPVGVALATLIKVKLEPSAGISVSAISSAGSGENIKLLRENQAQFAILQGLWGAYGWNGAGPVEVDGPQENLRSITMLWPNVEHFVINSEYAETGTIDDITNLEGQPFSIGARNSGTEGSNRAIFAGLGIDPDTTFEVVYQGYTPSSESLQNGNIAGMSLPAGPPVSAVAQAFAAIGDQLTLLSFNEEQAARANGDYELWTLYEIPGGTYPGVDEAVTTIAQPNFLAVNADVPEETVYQITKTIYENLPFLHNIHAATKNMSLERAIAGLPAPLHPGAARYYAEQGIEIPANLQAPE